MRGWNGNMNIFILKNKSGMKAYVSNYGATLVKLLVPSESGELADVVLGYDTKEEYEAGDMFIGGTIGRYANRIGGASFELDGEVYDLDANDGVNTLHSGCDFYNKRLWEVKNVSDSSIVFHLKSPDWDQGFPGNLSIDVTYALTDDNKLEILYAAKSDANTYLSLTNHSYFNLNGGGDARDHVVWINADYITEVDEGLIPTGKLIAVKDTDFDFTTARAVNAARDGDYDHNYVLSEDVDVIYDEDIKKAASAYSDVTGIKMNVYTDMPCMQFYTASHVDAVGKDSQKYGPYSAICFETQFAPDAMHHEEFEQPLLKAGETFTSKTVYAFEF